MYVSVMCDGCVPSSDVDASTSLNQSVIETRKEKKIENEMDWKKNIRNIGIETEFNLGKKEL